MSRMSIDHDVSLKQRQALRVLFITPIALHFIVGDVDTSNTYRIMMSVTRNEKLRLDLSINQSGKS